MDQANRRPEPENGDRRRARIRRWTSWGLVAGSSAVGYSTFGQAVPLAFAAFGALLGAVLQIIATENKGPNHENHARVAALTTTPFLAARVVGNGIDPTWATTTSIVLTITALTALWRSMRTYHKTS